MAFKLTRFQVKGLHRQWDIDILIKENRLVLVGENGTGKSTIANLLFLTLTQQWVRLMEFEFDSILIEVAGRTFEIHHRNNFEDQRVFDYVMAMMGDKRPGLFVSARDYLDLGTKRTKSFNKIYSRAMKFVESEIGDSSRVEKLLDSFRKIEEVFKADVDCRFLSLPTYRRIEQELSHILHVEHAKLDDVRELLQTNTRGANYLELIQFGMSDVELLLEKTTWRIKESVRIKLEEITGEYLQEILKGKYEGAQFEHLQNLSKESLDDIVAFIDPLLGRDEKAEIMKIIKKIRKGNTLGGHDKVIAHFLAKLIILHDQQREWEKPLRTFVGIVNGYLLHKKLVYNANSYAIQVQLIDDSTQPPGEIHWKHLSSGEKQIISLFAHVTLADVPSFFLVIDEPELSLSVPWQRSLLPDILRTGKCAGLFVVTHSPFVYDNELDAYTQSISEFLERP